jgi:hypothetical protein
VKQGQPPLTREIGDRIMRRCVAVDNTQTVHEIVFDVLGKAVTADKWEPHHFVRTDAYRPAKNNVAVQRFVARMRARTGPLFAPPEPGARFGYVIVKPGSAARAGVDADAQTGYDLRGRRVELKKGDLMEYAAVATALGMRIDVAYYMVHYVAGLCARFVNGDYAPAETDDDAAAQKAAKKAIETYLRVLGGDDPAEARRRGVAYRAAYRAAAAQQRAATVARIGSAASSVLDGEHTSYDVLEEGIAAVVAAADAAAAAAVGRDGAAWCALVAARLGVAASGEDAGGDGTAHNLYAIRTDDGASFEEPERAATAALGAALERAGGAAVGYRRRLEAAVIAARGGMVAATANGAEVPDSHSEFDAAALLEFRRAFLALVAARVCRRRRDRLAEYVARLKEGRIRGAMPTNGVVTAMAAAAIAAIAPGARRELKAIDLY